MDHPCPQLHEVGKGQVSFGLDRRASQVRARLNFEEMPDSNRWSWIEFCAPGRLIDIIARRVLPAGLLHRARPSVWPEFLDPGIRRGAHRIARLEIGRRHRLKSNRRGNGAVVALNPGGLDEGITG